MKLISIIFFILLMLAQIPCQSSPVFNIKKGNKLYIKQNYTGAEKQYQKAQTDSPEDPVPTFNLGDSLYKQNKFKEALKEFLRLADAGKNLAGKTYYNLGNTLFKLNNLEEAIKYYKESLKINPEDKDAKYNLEFTLKKLNEQKENKKQEQQKKKDENKNKQKDKEDKEKNKDKQENKKQEKDTGENKNIMDKKDIQRLLNLLKEEEKNAMSQKKANLKYKYKTDIDW